MTNTTAAFILAFTLLISGCTSSPEVPLQISLKDKGIDAIKSAIEEGYDINEKSKFGRTLLHTVARSSQEDGRLEKIRFLINNGADVNTKDRRGQTALDVFVYHNTISWASKEYIETIKTFIDAETKIKFRDTSTSLNILYKPTEQCNADAIKALAPLMDFQLSEPGMVGQYAKKCFDHEVYMTLVRHGMKIKDDDYIYSLKNNSELAELIKANGFICDETCKQKIYSRTFIYGRATSDELLKVSIGNHNITSTQATVAITNRTSYPVIVNKIDITKKGANTSHFITGLDTVVMPNVEMNFLQKNNFFPKIYKSLIDDKQSSQAQWIEVAVEFTVGNLPKVFTRAYQIELSSTIR